MLVRERLAKVLRWRKTPVTVKWIADRLLVSEASARQAMKELVEMKRARLTHALGRDGRSLAAITLIEDSDDE